LEARALEMKVARALLDPTAEAEMPPVELRVHYMREILTNDGNNIIYRAK